MKAIDGLDEGEQIIHPSILKICMLTLIAINIGYIIASFNRIPVSIVICLGASFLLIVYAISPRISSIMRENRKGVMDLAKEINWDIILFMMSIFIVVQGLKHANAIEFFTYLFLESLKLPYFLFDDIFKHDSYGGREHHEQLADYHTRASIDKADSRLRYRFTPYLEPYILQHYRE